MGTRQKSAGSPDSGSPHSDARQNETPEPQRLARALLDYLEREQVVERFVAAYVTRFDRQALRADPAQYRELIALIRRELLVALSASALARLPRYFLMKKRQWAAASGSRTEHQFRKDFFSSLAAELGWQAEERERFETDVKSYAARSAVARPPQPGEVGARHAAPSAPFVERCALLLDPSFLDQARSAAEKWVAEIEKAAEDSLKASALPT